MSKDLEQTQIDVLSKENDRLSTDIRGLEAMNDKFASIGVTVIGAAFLYGIEKHLVEMFFVAPVAIFALLLFTLDRLRSMAWLGGYKHAVEDAINRRVGSTVVKWEDLVQNHRGRSDIIIKSTFVIYVLILGGTSVYSGYKILTSPVAGVALLAFVIVIVALSILLILSVKQLSRAYEAAYEHSSGLLMSAAGAVEVSRTLVPADARTSSAEHPA